MYTKWTLRSTLLVFVAGLQMGVSTGQPVTSTTQNSGLQTRPLSAYERLGGRQTEEYTIGDEIDVQVVGRPELSGHHLVGPDGKITLPFAGSFDIKNMTRENAALAITKSFERYYTSVDVTVQVSKYGSNRILVVGHVAQPGVQYFDNPPTLLEALTKSRPLPPSGSGKETDFALPQRCAILRGEDEPVWIDVKTMIDRRGSGMDLRLRRDDVLYIPEEQDDLVAVLGQVQRPGMIKIDANSTLLDVIARSGGLTPDAGVAKIQIVRKRDHLSREVSLRDLLDPAKASEITLQNGDVVFVRPSNMAKFESALAKLSPLGTLLLFGSTLAVGLH
jgi:polysaccharide export outer membrane protein